MFLIIVGATPVIPEGTHNDHDNDQGLPNSVQGQGI